MDARELCVGGCRVIWTGTKMSPASDSYSQPGGGRWELGRQREFWKKQLRRLENHGRALRIEHEHETLEAGWAGPRKWKRIGPARCSEFVRVRFFLRWWTK